MTNEECLDVFSVFFPCSPCFAFKNEVSAQIEKSVHEVLPQQVSMASATENTELSEVESDLPKYHFPLENVPRLNYRDPEAERFIRNEVV